MHCCGSRAYFVNDRASELPRPPQPIKRDIDAIICADHARWIQLVVRFGNCFRSEGNARSQAACSFQKIASIKFVFRHLSRNPFARRPPGIHRKCIACRGEPAVLNASPLIILAKAGYLDLVPNLVSPVIIPRAVAAEINAGPADDAALQFFAQPSWLPVIDLPPVLSPLAHGAWDRAKARCSSTQDEIRAPLPYLMTRLRDGQHAPLVSHSQEPWA